MTAYQPLLSRLHLVGTAYEELEFAVMESAFQNMRGASWIPLGQWVKDTPSVCLLAVRKA